MKSHRFMFGKFMRSYWDLYFGYGLLAILTGLIEVVLIWQLAALVSTAPLGTRPVVGLLFLFNIGHAVLVWRYFSLIVPVVFDLVIGLCLTLAFVSIAA